MLYKDMCQVWTFRSPVFSLLGAKMPGSEKSLNPAYYFITIMPLL